jgi:two-component system OmpR family response regulator
MKSVLIVDDDDLLREMFTEILRIEGFVVSEAADSKEAMAMVHTKTFDVITLDIALGDEDGRSLINPIRAHAPKSKIFLLTGMDDNEATEAGTYVVDGVFSKAQPMEDLIAQIGGVSK